jgi:predicted small secreted protein
MASIPHSARSAFRFYCQVMKTNQITLVQRLVLLFLATTLLTIVGVGCNTAHGFGKDMEKGGEKIQDATK